MALERMISILLRKTPPNKGMQATADSLEQFSKGKIISQ
jgi:hypothetical protein